MYRESHSTFCGWAMKSRDICIHMEYKQYPDVIVLREIVKGRGRHPIFNLDEWTSIRSKSWLTRNSLTVDITRTSIANGIEQISISLFFFPLVFQCLPQFLTITIWIESDLFSASSSHTLWKPELLGRFALFNLFLNLSWRKPKTMYLVLHHLHLVNHLDNC